MSDLNKLKELVETLKPNYGAAGSRDVDVTAKRKAADELIDRLEAAEVFGKARVFGNARVFGEARVFGNAMVRNIEKSK